MRRQGGNCRENESRLDCTDEQREHHDADAGHSKASKVDLESLKDGESRMRSQSWCQ